MVSIDIAPEVRLKRFIYFCSEESRYISSNKKNHFCCRLSDIGSLFELISGDKEDLIIDLIDSVKNDPTCSRRETLIFVLAALTRNAKTPKVKFMAYDRVLEVCSTTEELFLFITFAHCLNKTFSHGIRRVLRNYYLKREPMDLFNIVTLCNRYYGWTHQDVFKLIHIKAEKNTAQEIIFSYIMKDMKYIKNLIHSMETNDNTPLIHDIYAKIEKFDTFKHCHSEQQAITLIKENNYKMSQIPCKFLKLQAVWEYLIPNLDILDLLPQLVRLSRLGFLKSNNPNSMLNKVVEILSDTKKCIASKIQPAQALLYLKTFERGKPIDPHKLDYINRLENPEGAVKSRKKQIVYMNAPKNNAIVSALYKLLQHSFKNVQSTGRRFLITIDARDDYMKTLCLSEKLITCWEATVLIALSLVRAEKDVTVAIFDGANINTVPIDKNMTFAQALQTLKETKGGFVVLNNTFNWAVKNNKPIDVFLNILFSADILHRAPAEIKSAENVIVSLKRYRQKVHLQNTKMINVSIAGKKLQIADGSPHILDICGFDHHVPKLIEACCKGVLQ